MKCSKCGEEYKENQAFCLKCGNPIQVVPDFNLIEAELASNIGELMNELESADESPETAEEDDIKEVQMNDMELQLVDISRAQRQAAADGRTKVIGDISQMIQEEQEAVDTKDDRESIAELYQKEKNRRKNTKKLVLLIVSAVIILAAAVAVFVMAAKSVEKTATSYEEYYEKAQKFYNSMNTADALENAENALDKASNDEERLKARKLIYDIHLLSGKKSDSFSENLEQLIALGAKDIKYYKSLAEYYDKNEEYTNLTSLLLFIEDENILSELSEYVVKEPKADMESGNYKEYMAVTLSAEEGYTIYFTTDSRNPSNYGQKYETPIQLAKEGESVIKAIAVNEKGVESKPVTYTYNIKLSGSNAPKVTPSGGAYSDYTKIKIEVPEGGKVFYTWDGAEPDDKSTEYTEEIEMKRGINVLKVIAYDKYGIASEVAQESYNLQIKRALSLNDAVSLVQSKAKEEAGEPEVTAAYDSTVTIDNDEYYIIIATVQGSDGAADKLTIYAVNTYDKSIRIAVDEDGKYALEEESTE